MNAQNLLIKLNVNKKEKKEIMSIEEKVNYLVVPIGFMRVFNVGFILSLQSIDKNNMIKCVIENKFFDILKDKIDYIDFKKEYLKQQGKVLFKIKLKENLSKEEENKIKSFFD